jgi:hypothetical protein
MTKQSLASINEEFGEVMKNMGSLGKEHIVFFAEQIA